MESPGDLRARRIRTGIIVTGFAMPVVFGLPTLFVIGFDDIAVFLTLILMQFPIMGVFNAIPYFVLSYMIDDVGEKGSRGYAGRAVAAVAYGLTGVGFSLYTNVRVFVSPDPSGAKGYFVIPLVGLFCWMAIRAIRAMASSFAPAGGRGAQGRTPEKGE
jgi:hypothetical protein